MYASSRAEDERRAEVLRGARGVRSGHETLPRRLLVARGPVDLAREEEPRQRACLERHFQLLRKNDVVFDGVSRPEDLCPLEPINQSNDLFL